MAVYKEIAKADGSGVTTFYRLSDVHDTAEVDESESEAVVFDYNQAQNKPSINNVALVGNKTSEDLGLQPAGDYITNDEADAKFVDEDELGAKNYVDEAQLQEALANIEHFHREIVAALPVTGDPNVLYLVRKQGSGEDIFNEYIWVGRTASETGYEFIGTTATDLTDYYQKDEVDDLLDGKVDKVSGRGLSDQNYTLSEKTKLAGLHNYDDTELQVKVANLHNYDDTDLQLRVGDLEVKEEADSNAISTIQDALDKKMICIRLVEQGDGWTWMDINGSRLTFDRAQAYLGQENCMLFVEQLENDGKVIPAEYKSETTRIRVLFKDLDSLVHIMTLGEEDLLVEDIITTEDGACDFEVENEAVDFGARLDEFYGNTSQETTTGKNLLHNIGTTTTINGITFTPQEDGSILVNGTATARANYFFSPNRLDLEAGTYTMSSYQKGTTANTDVYMMCYVNNNGDNSYKNSGHRYITFSVSSGAYIQGQFYISVNSGATANNVVIYPQFEKGSTATSYEPYTNGPSPNPDYPQDIHVVSGDNSIDVCGKNLLPINSFSPTGAGDILTNYPLELQAGQYTISCNLNITSTKNMTIRFDYGDGTNTTIDIYAGTTQTTFTLSKKSIKITWYVREAYTMTNVMLERGDTKTTYEEHKEQTYPINLGSIELCKIGDYQDKIYKQDDKWYVEKQIGKVVLDGSEVNWQQSGYTNETIYSAYRIIPDYKHDSLFISDLFSYQENVSAITTNEYIATGGNSVRIGVFKSRLSGNTLNDFKIWLSTNNTILCYILATPTISEITDPTLLTQLENLQQITQYKHTYIDLIPATSNEMPDAQFTYISNAVINASDRILGKDTYWNDEVPTSADLPSNAEEGEIRIVQDTQNVYIYDGTNWIPFDKGGEVDLSNYLAKDNTTAWIPTSAFNPATKKYVDDSIGGVFVPTKTSQLTNDSNFIGKNSNDLTYYYTKSQTYNKAEVDALIGGGGGGGSSDVQITVTGDTLVITTQPAD